MIFDFLFLINISNDIRLFIFIQYDNPQVHPSSYRFGGRQLLDLLCSFRKYAKVPVFIHVGTYDFTKLW